MTLPNELHPGFFTAAGGGGFTLDQSLRFRSSQVAYLSRTPGSGGSRTTWTYSFWYKPGSKTLVAGLTGAGTVTFLSVNNTETNTTYAEFLSESDRLTFQGATVTWVMPDARIRDNSAWYHMVLICDTTNGTSTDRVRFYLNGERQTVFVQSSMPGSGDQLGINQTVEHTIGKRQGTNNNPLDGLLAEVNFIDGTAIADTNGILNEFGEYNQYGIWVPKAYGGSYGTQGYHLTFDSSGKAGQSGAGAAVGADQSDNNNHWTANNFDTTAISASNFDNDVDYFDTPTSNYATGNPIQVNAHTETVLNDANLTWTNSAASQRMSTIPISDGKWYFEYHINGSTVSDEYPHLKLQGINGETTGALSIGPRSYFESGVTADWTSHSLNIGGNTTVRVTYDSSNGQVVVTSSGGNTFTRTWTAGNTGGAYADGNEIKAGIGFGINSGVAGVLINFGQRNFVNSAPAGFKKLQTNNLTTVPTIKNGKDQFDVVTWSGDNASPRTITGLEFEPDFIWTKRRNSTASSLLYDSVRGFGETKHLHSDNAEPEGSNNELNTNVSGYVSDNASNGFVLTAGTSNHDATNGSGNTYVAWCWKAGGTPSVTYTVKVVSDSGNKYRFNDFGASAVTLDLEEGGTYVFDQSDSSNSNHPLRFSTTSNGTHGGGSEYTTGVVTTGVPGQAGAKTTITVAASAPTLFYYCSVHSGMGGQANTNTTKGSSNFDGTIQSKVTANTDAGFSIVSYTGTNNSKTVGHGLNSTPEFIIVKNRNDSANWIVYHKDVNPAGSSEDWYLMLHVDDARTLAGDAWGSTAPGSSVYNVGAFNNTNGSGDGMIAYCFHSVEGYSKFGYYVGAATGSSPNADGPYVHLGFKPAYLLIKRTDSSSGGEWSIHDTQRDPINSNRQVIAADLPNGEITQGGIDFLSNGFKIRDGAGWTNQTGGNYVYAAFAESPFGGQNVSPATAR